MSGLSINQFLDWDLATSRVFLSGTKRIINSVSRRSFILGKFLRGKKASVILQGGNNIKETLYLSPKRTMQVFQRGEEIAWQNLQKDVLVSLQWKFTVDQMAWDEAEYILQTGGLSGSDLRVKYKDMAFSKRQRTWESMIDGWEDLLWQAPNGAAMYASMEGANGAQPYSIPVFIHENQGGSGRFDSNWTEIETINPGTFANWDNARATYDVADPLDSDDDQDGLFNGFDSIAIDINYRQPGIKDLYFEDEAAIGNQHLIATSKKGKILVMDLNRKSNDNFITPQDGSYPYPRWSGQAIMDVQALDAAPLYAGDNSTFVAETAATVTKTGARFYFLNCEYLKVIWHKAKYFKMAEKPKEPERTVGQYVVPVESWGNMVCTSRRHQGLLSPQ